MKILLPFFLLFPHPLFPQSADNSFCFIAGSLTNFISGAPVRKARVTATPRGPHPEIRETFSDSSGRFRLEHLRPGAYRIAVQREGFLTFTYGAKTSDSPSKFLTLAPGENHSDLNFALQPPGAISGRVIDDDGDPLDGVGVQALHMDFNRGQTVIAATATTNDLGEYRLFGLPPGKFQIVTLQRFFNQRAPAQAAECYPSVFYPGTPDLPSAASLNIAAGAEARDIDIRVTKSTTATLRGVVADLPPEARNALQLRLVSRNREALSPPTLAAGFPGGIKNNSGDFEFINLPLGSYVLFGRYQIGDAWFFARQDIEISGSDVNGVRLDFTKSISLPATVQITGNVSGNAKAAVTRLSLTRSDPYGVPNVTTPVPAEFTLTSLNPGVWHASVITQPPDAFVESIRLGQQDGLTGNLEIRPDTTGPLAIVLGALGGKLEGAVHSPAPNPHPLESAAVLLIPSTGIAAHLKATVSGPDGRFQLRGIAPGKYHLLAFEELSPNATRDPDFLRSLEGRGLELSISIGPNPAQDLTPTVAP